MKKEELARLFPYQFLVFLLLSISCQTSTPKVKRSPFEIHQHTIRQEVLKNNIIDSLFIYGKWNEDEGTETQLKYLGEIKSKQEVFKIMTSVYLWGLSRRATNRILVFNQKKKYLGNYYGFNISNLPQKLENNQLIFFHLDDEDCDSKIINRLSFENGIPNEFFIECKDGMGDIYSFDPDRQNLG